MINGRTRPHPLQQGRVALGPAQVQAWVVALNEMVGEVPRFGSMLSPDERRRAACFNIQRDRDRFVVARGVLRSILGSLTGDSPGQLTFAYGANGKPRLAARPDIYFNLSHSNDVVMIAVTRIGPVGIDVERVQVFDDLAMVALRFFAGGESARLATLSVTERPAAFFRCWTRKEAYLKALGEGISSGLDRVEVSLEPGAPARFLALSDLNEDVGSWSLFHMEPLPGYVAAIALKGNKADLCSYHWRSHYAD